MRILVLGAGAIGGWFGARLVEAGNEVAFLVRPARAARLAQDGLRIAGARGGFARPVRAITAVDGHYDLVILSCKAYDLDTAIASIAPAVGPHSLVLPLLNGVRQLDALDAAFDAERVLGGLCHISVTLEDDGTIRQFGALERLAFGSRGAAAMPDRVRAALLSIGPQAQESPDVLGAMWDKFAFIAALAGITCLMRATVGEIVATPDGHALVQRLYRECVEVATREGRAPDAAAQAAALAILCAAGSPLKASMLRDLERGARTECEHILGDLRARAVNHDLDTPILDAALAHLRVHEDRTASRGKNKD